MTPQICGQLCPKLLTMVCSYNRVQTGLLCRWLQKSLMFQLGNENCYEMYTLFHSNLVCRLYPAFERMHKKTLYFTLLCFETLTNGHPAP